MIKADKIKDLLHNYEIGRLSHAFLVETNNYDYCLKDIKELIKGINCPKKFNDNCQEECHLCKLIDLDNLPSIITIKPDGMSIKKGQLQELQEKFSMKPVYSKYNTYIIMNADLMNDSAANSILKFLEEPEDYILGFYITDNKENIIDTIKSRCQIIKVLYDSENIVDNKIEQIALNYLQHILNDGSLIINKEYVLRELTDRTMINAMFKFLFDLYVETLKKNYFPGNKNAIIANLTEETLKKHIFILENILHLNQYNVNLELLLDRFVIEMRGAHD